MDPVPERVRIREVALRDGLQIEQPIPLSAKLELLAALAATGVREIEATSFVSPTKVPALADAAELAAELGRYPGVEGIEFSALVASPRGAERAVAAGLRSIEYLVCASDAFSMANVGRPTMAALTATTEVAGIAHDAGATLEVIIATAFDCPFAGPTSPHYILDVAAAATAQGADRLSLADTIGTATPRRVTHLVEMLLQQVGDDDTELGAHFHNTRGAGLASAYAAVLAGVTRLDASIGGLGGCPFAPGATGNIATEDLVYLMRDCEIDTGVDLAATIAAAETARRIVGHDLPGALLRAGDRKLLTD